MKTKVNQERFSVENVTSFSVLRNLCGSGNQLTVGKNTGTYDWVSIVANVASVTILSLVIIYSRFL